MRDGAIGLGIAEALTLGTREQQAHILADITDGIWFDTDDVRARLIKEKPSVAMAVFPLDRYGGTVTADLFDTHGAPWWHCRAAWEGESGCVVINLIPAGRAEVRERLVRHEVQRAVAAETRESPLSVWRERPEYPAWLVRHMAAHKTLAVQTLLTAARRTAREVAVVLLMRGADAHHGRVLLEAHPALALFAGEDGRPRSWDAVEAVAARFERLLGLEPAGDDEPAYGPRSRGAWERLAGDPKDGAELYERVKRLSEENLDGLHLLLSILAFGQGDMDPIDHGDSLFNRAARDLGADMRDWWRPDAAFLGGRTRDQLGASAMECCASVTMARLSDYRKSELVAALATHFERMARTGDDAPDGQLRARRAPRRHVLWVGIGGWGRIGRRDAGRRIGTNSRPPSGRRPSGWKNPRRPL
ncbi:hypothetical protein [Azospirillum sp.]|uniref:hypothetical protein n=1 Tax=Azospirillum sp. TaxID=34012 RepID=UPI003D71678F